MSLIKRLKPLQVLRVLLDIWPQLKRSYAGCLITKYSSGKPDLEKIAVYRWQVEAPELAVIMLNNINEMVTSGRLDVKVATHFVAGELSRLMTLQVNQSGEHQVQVIKLQQDTSLPLNGIEGQA